jgi:hypothetical protein
LAEEEELPQPDKVTITQEPMTQAQIPLKISDEDEQEVDHQNTEDNTIFLLAEIDKWKQQVSIFGEGMILVTTHRKEIHELKEKYAEFFMSQKFKWEEMKKELGELKKLQAKYQILE